MFLSVIKKSTFQTFFQFGVFNEMIFNSLNKNLEVLVGLELTAMS